MPSDGPSPSTAQDTAAVLAAIRLAIGLHIAVAARSSYREVAGALGCAEAPVRANVYQAVRRLRRELGETVRGTR